MIKRPERTMGYTIIQPCNELKHLIRYFWVGSEDINDAYYATANTRIEMIFGFKLQSNQSPDFLCSLVQGQTNRFAQYPAIGFCELFGVSLYPNAIHRFFNLSASELNNQFIGLDTLLGNQGKMLNEAVANTTTVENRIKTLTEYFKSQLTQSYVEDKPIIQAIKKIKRSKGSLNINDLASEFNLSLKQFERRFRTYSGFSPKLYSRIVRFESVLQHHHTYNSLTEAAYANGYYDQSHLIYDFKIFSGFSPSKFFGLTQS